MSWASIAAKATPSVRPESKPQVVRAGKSSDEKEPLAPAEPAEVEVKAKSQEVYNCPDRKVLVVDTGGLIKGGGSGGLANLADEFFTIQDVLSEVRDKKTRAFVESFPFELRIVEPTKEAMTEVIRVAKVTGDFGTLSAVDLRVVGLAYTLAAASNALKPPANLPKAGISRQKPKINTSRPGANKNASVPSLPGWGEWDTSEDKEADAKGHEEEEEEEQPEEPETKAEEVEEDVEDAVEVEGGWITKDNIKDYNGCKEKFGEDDADERNIGCMTTDFAMQNVLMHLGVQVVSVEGYRVKHLKKWVLRCHGCYAIVKDTTRQFCPECGSGDTLKRVSYTINETGEEEIWINPRRRINIRGTIYNLPKPRGGRSGTNRTFVIREDQLLHNGRNYNHEDKREDYVAQMLSDDWMFAGESRDKKRPQHVKASKSSYSSKNPNKGRKRKV
eukprot:TRINITY_DN22170_c0_g2_i1.p1 TRINITY_DN22170_c0_g2~~TRINITY_DN22170_c0_g2_i1.p1  ORF type:complete len:445 (+),score=130.56 TRINITY_DN22170_c0_g2_i1:44-1378(+)